MLSLFMRRIKTINILKKLITPQNYRREGIAKDLLSNATIFNIIMKIR